MSTIRPGDLCRTLMPSPVSTPWTVPGSIVEVTEIVMEDYMLRARLVFGQISAHVSHADPARLIFYNTEVEVIHAADTETCT